MVQAISEEAVEPRLWRLQKHSPQALDRLGLTGSKSKFSFLIMRWEINFRHYSNVINSFPKSKLFFNMSHDS
jgi:hypothetical protein